MSNDTSVHENHVESKNDNDILKIVVRFFLLIIFYLKRICIFIFSIHFKNQIHQKV
jgi:hypothetical protein